MQNYIDGVIVRVLTSSTVDHGFESRQVKPKSIKKSDIILVGSEQNNASEWSDMSLHGLLAQNRIIHLSGVTCLSTDCWLRTE